MTTKSFEALGGPPPSMGEDIVVEVIPSQTRATLFPDFATVFGRGNDAVELVLLRQEVSLKSQRGTVTGLSDDALTLNFAPNAVRAELYDIGHVRLTMDSAVELGVALLAHGVNTGGKDMKALVKRLQSSVVKST